MSATIVMIIFHVTRREVTYSMYRTEEAERSDISGCAYLNIRGDQICDDEVNTEECQFDLGDCCDVQNDFTLCSDCFCYSAGHLNNSLSKDCPSKSGLELYLEDYIGDGKCQLELNNVEYFFDAGDCCLEYPECTITIQGDSSLWCQLWCVGTFYESHEVVCPEHVCIKSDIYCIQLLYIEYKFDMIKSKSEVFLTGKNRARGTLIPLHFSTHFIAAPTAVSN